MAITADAILTVVAEETKIAPDRLAPTATLADLDIASLDLVSVLFAIEDQFDVVVEVDEAARATTLQDFIDLVIAKSVEA